VLVGDGAFQMTGLEFSNMVRLGLDPIVVLFNNDGFGMQRVFQDGAFNAIQSWDFQRVVDLVGGGRAWRVSSPEELDRALGEAEAFREGPSLVEVVYPKGVISTGLRLISQALLREKTGHCPLAPPGATSCEHAGQCGFCRAAIWR
jgi:indolepyruvate decarboxylase